MEITAPPSTRTGSRDADGMAVTSFALGLVGLVVLNLVLGPIAIVLASRALSHHTARRSRALFGLALGIADIVLFAVLFATDNSPMLTGM